MRYKSLVAVVCVLAPLGVPEVVAQTTKDLVGTWTTVSDNVVNADGTTIPRFGPKGAGMAIFSADGHFVIINHNPEVPTFFENSRFRGTPEEYQAAVHGALGIFGSYTMTGNTVNMKVEGSTYPNWTGTLQTRTITEYTGDELTWRVRGSEGPADIELVWKRTR